MPIGDLYLAASYLRDLAFKYERCQEEHSTEKWTTQDDKNLEELFKILLTSNYPPEFEYNQKDLECYEQIIEYVNDLVKNRLSTSKVPPTPHMASLLADLKAQREEALKRVQKSQKEINELARQRIELLKKLQQRFPKVHQSILEKIVDDFEASVLLESPEEALLKTAEAVNEVAQAFNIKDADTAVILKDTAKTKELEAFTKVPPKTNVPLLDPQKLNAYQRQKIELALIKEFAEYGLSPTEAVVAARNYMTLELPFATYALSRFAPNKKQKAEVFRDFTRTAFDEVLAQLKFIPQKQTVGSFEQLRQVLEQNYEPYAENPDYYRVFRSNGDQEINPFFSFVLQQGKDKAFGEASKFALNKFSTWLGGKAAQTAVTATAETATTSVTLTAGAALAPETLGTSLLIAAAIELGKTVASKAKILIKKNGKYAVAAIAGLVVFGGGLLVGGLGLLGSAAAGLGTAVVTAAVQTMGGPVAVLGNVASGFTYFSSQLVGLVATEIAAPIIIIAISIPIVIALILFIITTSAFVVPVNLMNAPEYGTIVNPPLGPGGEYPNCWPVRGHISQGPYCSTGSFSHCSYVYGTNYRYGNSIDIKGALGDPVYATHNGKAYPCPPSYDSGYGICVVVESSLGFKTIYAHLSDRITTTIDPITAGTLIGKRGSTGWSTGPHLHYELINSKGRQLPPPFTMPPPKAPNGLVPTYQAGGQTAGCFANESGGSATGVQ